MERKLLASLGHQPPIGSSFVGGIVVWLRKDNLFCIWYVFFVAYVSRCFSIKLEKDTVIDMYVTDICDRYICMFYYTFDISSMSSRYMAAAVLSKPENPRFVPW